MSTTETNSFTSYSFSKEEYPLAVTFSELQLQHIQTQLALYAEQKISISAETYSSPEMFVRNHEYHRGLCDGMRFLIELHTAYRDSRTEEEQKVAASQEEDWMSKVQNRMRDEDGTP